MMPVDCIPGNSRLRRIAIEFPEAEEQVLSLQFEHDGVTRIVTVYSPDSVADVLELTEVLIGSVDVLDAGLDQQQGFRQKLLFETDKGEFEIWATKIHVETRR